ncbi:hypothetical protein PG1C_10340 [Rugosibacter aromaticivorans]|uniref:DUF5666 domain-containing protein n=1 Tax=Rugosibacter aromaticivorans TaxID=1565605 RepID=A0A0C5JAD1_9PROT|nr:hypothetical protein [Rugosibacter aromaticivorans]AJP48728.1 hypothetical protein PG1C_10340 [Rugosibacter aromaticivorans]TBR14217.1 MAG: hypothetical protein EPO43_08260 [Rugosibacter sp.]
MKRAYCLVLGLLVTSTTWPAHAASTPLGRLFFTPEKRLTLERQRLSKIQETQTLEGATMSLDGIVQRSSGKSTVWINGRAQDEHDAARTGVSVRLTPKDPGQAQLSPGEESPTQLKVGEAINRATGERNDRLGGGTVKTPASRH